MYNFLGLLNKGQCSIPFYFEMTPPFRFRGDMPKSTGRQRNTRQREVLKALLGSSDRPLAIEEIHELAGDELPSLGLRTVYRNIREMEAEELLIAIHYPGQPVRYEWVTGKHRPHFICTQCNRTFYMQEETPEIQYSSPEPFEIQYTELIFYGRCNQPDCHPEGSAKD